MHDFRVEKIIDWIDRMVKKYGHPIIDGPERDWGQVLCRMRFGKNWGNHPEFEFGPTNEDLINCGKLERHEWPDWIH